MSPVELSPRLASIERWLDRLSIERGPQPGEQDQERVLFILDNDFGELTTVLYLVLGQSCFRTARVLVSPRLFEKNQDALPGRIESWSTEQDLVAAIEGTRPRLIVLASAYLLPVHGLLSVAGVERLLALARRQQALVVTADPFLGLLSQWSSRGLEQLISIDIPAHADERLRVTKRGADALLHRELGAVEQVLRPLPHLYPSHTDLSNLTPASTDGRNLSFFNEALCLPPHLATPASSREGQAHWMFVLSLADFQTQIMFHGAQRFAAIVSRLLLEAAELGRQAIFLGPDPLCELLKPLLPKKERIQLLSFCSFRRVMSLLLSAEYCFYWNVVSHSILMQLQNGRPVLLFDRGHLVRAAPALYERVIAWYYQGWEPPYLDHEQSLSLDRLAEASAAHARHGSDLVQGFRRAPAPADLLRALLEQPVLGQPVLGQPVLGQPVLRESSWSAQSASSSRAG